MIRFTSGYFVNRQQSMCLYSGHTPALPISLLCFSGLTHFLPTVSVSVLMQLKLLGQSGVPFMQLFFICLLPLNTIGFWIFL